jgi:hypothetical protein
MSDLKLPPLDLKSLQFLRVLLMEVLIFLTPLPDSLDTTKMLQMKIIKSSDKEFSELTLINILNPSRELKDKRPNSAIGLDALKRMELKVLKIYTRKFMLKLEKILIIKRKLLKLVLKEIILNILSQD